MGGEKWFLITDAESCCEESEFPIHRERDILGTVVSKIITPEILFFSELIRRRVIYYAGSFLPQIIFSELIMRGNSVSHYVDRRVFWGVKFTPNNRIIRDLISNRVISELPHKIVFVLIG